MIAEFSVLGDRSKYYKYYFYGYPCMYIFGVPLKAIMSNKSDRGEMEALISNSLAAAVPLETLNMTSLWDGIYMTDSISVKPCGVK